MKSISSTNLLFATVVTLIASVTIGQSGQAQRGQGFYCDTSNNAPVTVYQNSRGDIEPWIRWTSNYFRNAGYDPLTRCRDVSARLENYRRNRELKFITVGQMNGQNVICTASEDDGQCEGLVLTLKPKEDPVRALNNLFAWHTGATYAAHRGKNPYVDVRERLDIRRE